MKIRETSYSPEFHVKVQISQQMNLKEQLSYIKEIINFSAIDLIKDVNYNFLFFY